MADDKKKPQKVPDHRKVMELASAYRAILSQGLGIENPVSTPDGILDSVLLEETLLVIRLDYRKRFATMRGCADLLNSLASIMVEPPEDEDDE